MNLFSKVIIGSATVIILWQPAAQAERNKYETALAADMWNSFANRDDLEAFLTTDKNKSEKAAIKKFLSGYSEELPLAVFKGDVIQFGNDKTKWAVDSVQGFWMDDGHYIPDAKAPFVKKIESFKKWNKKSTKTSMLQVWVQPAYADVDDETARAMYSAFIQEYKTVMGTPCMMALKRTALQRMPEDKVQEKDKPRKLTSVGIFCHDQNPAKETIFTAAHGPHVIMKWSGEFVESKSTGKRFLKKIRWEDNGENIANLNFIETATGSELHTTEIKGQNGGKTEVFDKDASPAALDCSAKDSQRLILAIEKVCTSVRASSYVQRAFGQMSGPAPAKAEPGSNEQPQGK